MREAFVKRVAFASVRGKVDDGHPVGVGGSHCVNMRSGVIVRAIVYCDDMEQMFGIVAIEDALQASTDHRAFIVRRDDHRQAREGMHVRRRSVGTVTPPQHESEREGGGDDDHSRGGQGAPSGDGGIHHVKCSDQPTENEHQGQQPGPQEFSVRGESSDRAQLER